jgi:hypothetical protein
VGRGWGKVKFDPPFSNISLSGSAYAVSGSRRFHSVPASRAALLLALNACTHAGSESA